MNPRLTGFYIHLPDSLPESAAEVLDTSLKNLNELSDKLNASAQDLGIRIVNPRILVRKHSILSSLKEKDSLETLDLSNEPYEALKTILAKPDLPVEDLEPILIHFGCCNKMFVPCLFYYQYVPRWEESFLSTRDLY